MWLALTCITSLILGFEVAAQAWRPDDLDELTALERALFASVLGITLWLGSTWLVALVHLLTRPVLIARALVFTVAAIALLAYRLRSALTMSRSIDLHAIGGFVLIATLPLLCFVQFSFWRGLILPPVSIDALSYHLPKAIMYVRAMGYDALSSVRFLIGWRPANYELLLADAIVSDGTARFTTWISTLFYILFALSAAVMGQRWWGRNVYTAMASTLVSASVPVVLLHAAEYKNDVMAAYFITAALVAMGRWLEGLDWRCLLITVLALMAAMGTKTHAALIVGITFPFLVWPIVRGRVSRSGGALLGLLAVTAIAGLLLGGVSYVSKIQELLPRQPLTPAFSVPESADRRGYGDWSNLWKGPYLLIAEPFSTDSNALLIPWDAQSWPWRRYEMYYSELGIPFSLCALLMPWCMLRFRACVKRESLIVTTIALAGLIVILPVHYVPTGLYLLGLPRFALFVVPVVFSWTLVPIVAWCSKDKRHLANALVGAGAACFVIYAILAVTYDSFAPIGYVRWMSGHPGSRYPPRSERRASVVFDQHAGPGDAVAVDAGVGSMLYTIFSSNLRRPVEFVPPGVGSPVISDAARWLVVDRGWNIILGHRDLKELGQAARLLARGEPSEADLRVFKSALSDRRFHLVYFDPYSMQAVFRRR